MRHMMTLRTIDSISAIPNADFIEAARIGGWVCVVSKGKFSAGDVVVFAEVDSFLPADVPEFKSMFGDSAPKKSVSPFTGKEVSGYVLKTKRIRGVYSQGAVFSPQSLGIPVDATQDEVDDYARSLGVFKWEPPVNSGSTVQGSFPSEFARKTDSERVQNLSDDFLSSLDPEQWYATEKIDGTSATFLVSPDGEFIVASRNWRVSAVADSPYSAIASRLQLEERMLPGMVIQGEIYGEGIQGNPLGASGIDIAIFATKGISEDSDVYKDVVSPRLVPRLPLVLPKTVEEAVAQVEGMRSVINPSKNAEGVVWWNVNGDVFAETNMRPNFKAINNKFLLKHKNS